MNFVSCSFQTDLDCIIIIELSTVLGFILFLPHPTFVGLVFSYDHGTKLKNDKWQRKVEAQGDTFMALCVEAGGRLNEQCLKLIVHFASISGSTEAERRAFTTFVCRKFCCPAAYYSPCFSTWSAQEPIPDGPCLLPPRGLLDLGVLPRRPLIQVTTTKRSEGQAPIWRDDAQRALSSLSIKNLLATIPVVHTPALASAAGAT